MAQDYSGQLDKSNNAIMAPKLSLHNLKCWQINLHRCKTASYNMCEVTKSVRSGLVLAQQPWTYATKIKSKLRGWNLFQGIENGNRSQACIYVTPDLCCSLIGWAEKNFFLKLKKWPLSKVGKSLETYNFVEIFVLLPLVVDQQKI